MAVYPTFIGNAKKLKGAPRPHISFIMDISGSMSNGGEQWCRIYNELVGAIKDLANTPYVSLWLFDDTVELPIPPAPADVTPLLEFRKNFVPRGGTSLFMGLNHAISAALQYMPDCPTLFVAITDGGTDATSISACAKRIEEAHDKGWGLTIVHTGVAYSSGIQVRDALKQKGVKLDNSCLRFVGSQAGFDQNDPAIIERMIANTKSNIEMWEGRIRDGTANPRAAFERAISDAKYQQLPNLEGRLASAKAALANQKPAPKKPMFDNTFEEFRVSATKMINSFLARAYAGKPSSSGLFVD